MKKLFLTAGLFLLVSIVYAQSPLSVGGTQINAGFGFSDHGLPVYVGFDHSVGHDFTLGGELSYRGYSDDWNNYNYHHDVWGISGNANYHFNRVLQIPRNWDFYAGLNVGFYAWHSPDAYHGDDTSGLGLGAQVGGRYYFSNKVGINFEIGGGNAFSGGKIGLTFKL